MRLRNFVWGSLAGFLLTGCLPVVERLFGIVTDISLLELADGAHPLLQELVRRAPGTYTHSITVATLAESAAEAIGANPLLTRMGSYFHDIGKMLKPHYFIENQTGENRHNALEPAWYAYYYWPRQGWGGTGERLGCRDRSSTSFVSITARHWWSISIAKHCG